MNKAILLVNVGTPDSPDVHDVKKYLSQFLNDPHVMNIPWLWRKILVNGMIIPFRARKSAAIYRLLWTKDGAPLRFYLEQVRDRLQQQLARHADVWAAFSYSQPNIADVMDKMQGKGYQQITVIPLFPQYAVSTTGSVEDNVKKHISRWSMQPKLKIVRQFYDEPLFLDAWNERIIAYHPGQYQHIVFSFHSLPLSHLPKECRQQQYPCGCMKQAEPCYRATCYDTAGRLANRLGLNEKQYTVAFQSHMSKRWMQPFTEDVLKKLAVENAKILVVAPSFVADCLETSIELGIEYKELFLKNGGSKYVWVESLNDHAKWIEALKVIGSDT